MLNRIPFVIAGAALATLAAPGQAQVRLVELPSRPVVQVIQEQLLQAPPRITDAEIRSNLHAKGYSRVHLIQLVGATYDVAAEKDGRIYRLEVDVLTGQITSSVPG